MLRVRTGSFTVNLFSTGSAACNKNPFAKCLSSFAITAGSARAGCGITLTPLAASGVTIPASWTANGSYVKYKGCPSAALSTSVAEAASLSSILDAVKGILNSALWRTAVTEVAAVPVISAGVLTYTASACPLKYRITSSIGIVGAETGACASVSGCESSANCTAGTFAVAVAGLVKTCALCPPGEHGMDWRWR